MSDGVEVWRGGVNTWECDEMGHMNVRFYVVRAMEGLAGLAAELGMPAAYCANAASTLLLREAHLRFLREAHAGAPLHMTGGVLSMTDEEAWVLLQMLHSRTGEPAATFRFRVAHAAPREGRVFPWPSRVRRAAETLAVTAPPHAEPRSLSLEPVDCAASLARAEALGLLRTGRGVLTPDQADAFGRMRAEHVIGRVSDGISGLLAPIRRAVLEGLGEAAPKRMGGAVLEYRLLYLDRPRIGDHLALRSGLAEITGKTQRLVHWLLDPTTGAPWVSSEAVAVNLDLDARKIVTITETAQAAVRPLITPGLTL